MCVVSAVVDTYRDKVSPWVYPADGTAYGVVVTQADIARLERLITELRKELEDCKRLIRAAKEIDEKTGQPDCEKPDAVKALKALFEVIGVDPEDLLD